MITLKWICLTGIDTYLAPGIDNNKITLLVIYGIIIAFTKLTKSKKDDNFVKSLFQPFFNLFKRKEAVNNTQPEKEKKSK